MELNGLPTGDQTFLFDLIINHPKLKTVTYVDICPCSKRKAAFLNNMSF